MCFPSEDLCWREAPAGEIHGKDKKMPNHKGYRRFHVEEIQRLGWKDKNLISRGGKNGTVKMDFWKKDLTWTEFRS